MTYIGMYIASQDYIGSIGYLTFMAFLTFSAVIIVQCYESGLK